MRISSTRKKCSKTSKQTCESNITPSDKIQKGRHSQRILDNNAESNRSNRTDRTDQQLTAFDEDHCPTPELLDGFRHPQLLPEEESEMTCYDKLQMWFATMQEQDENETAYHGDNSTHKVGAIEPCVHIKRPPSPRFKMCRSASLSFEHSNSDRSRSELGSSSLPSITHPTNNNTRFSQLVRTKTSPLLLSSSASSSHEDKELSAPGGDKEDVSLNRFRRRESTPPVFQSINRTAGLGKKDVEMSRRKSDSCVLPMLNTKQTRRFDTFFQQSFLEENPEMEDMKNDKKLPSID